MNNDIKKIDVLDQRSIDRFFMDCCKIGDLSTIKYMFNSRRLPIKPDLDYRDDYYDGLTHAAANGHLDVVEYLLYSTDLERNPRFNIFYYDYLSLICESSHFHVADYLLEKKIFDPIRAFLDTHKEANIPNFLSDYLIIHCDVPITPEVKDMIKNKPRIASLFEKRQLNKELNNTLAISDSTSKKFKL